MIAIPLLSGDSEILESVPIKVCVEEGIVSGTCNEYETKELGGFDISILGLVGVLYVIIGTLLLSRAKQNYMIMKYGFKYGWERKDNDL